MGEGTMRSRRGCGVLPRLCCCSRRRTALARKDRHGDPKQQFGFNIGDDYQLATCPRGSR